ncbi:class I SAM-dependent methyltransferase [Roseomonas sp. 18066]|uniref:class I SAM-dependent methyltransferase n=1 Tax=Roseomonas sp. 18066 TaxID=2681412 RepID=UPI001359F93F|nr:SAM-dependent methyltransferase [Roseomonas sp. 18066]
MNQDPPERLDHFMARAAAAYYAGRDPFGASGDFTTSPEISQAFGECLGLWCAVVWRAMGQPDPVLLVELGPGRGTLMADALRAVATVMPEFRESLQVHLVEQSPSLRLTQARTLLPTGAAPFWHDSIDTLPEGPALILANEFLDALPIRQFIRRGDGWMERYVAAGAFVELQAEGAPALPGDAPEGAVQETCEAGLGLARQLAARIADQGGAALFIDYGPGRSGPGDSLQALRQHQSADPLGPAGSADLTAHVDFQAIATAARAGGARAEGPLPQGIFLQGLGLITRASMLARSHPASAGMQLSAAQRLIAPEGMGRLFKALGLCHPDLPTLPGFETA